MVKKRTLPFKRKIIKTSQGNEGTQQKRKTIPIGDYSPWFEKNSLIALILCCIKRVYIILLLYVYINLLFYAESFRLDTYDFKYMSCIQGYVARRHP